MNVFNRDRRSSHKIALQSPLSFSDGQIEDEREHASFHAYERNNHIAKTVPFEVYADTLAQLKAAESKKNNY